jgi:hypothetical protein
MRGEKHCVLAESWHVPDVSRLNISTVSNPCLSDISRQRCADDLMLGWNPDRYVVLMRKGAGATIHDVRAAWNKFT